MTKLIELVYTSTLNSNADVGAIVRKSIVNNRRNKITGCLLQYKKFLVQILEGPEREVMNLLDKIEKDSRHSNVRLIYIGDADKRSFAKWAMASYQLKPEEFVSLIGHFQSDVQNKTKTAVYMP